MVKMSEEQQPHWEKISGQGHLLVFFNERRGNSHAKRQAAFDPKQRYTQVRRKSCPYLYSSNIKKKLTVKTYRGKKFLT